MIWLSAIRSLVVLVKVCIHLAQTCTCNLELITDEEKTNSLEQHMVGRTQSCKLLMASDIAFTTACIRTYVRKIQTSVRYTHKQ